MKMKKILGFVLSLSLIITCAIGVSTINGSAMQVSAVAPTTPTAGVASILSGFSRIYLDNGSIDTVYVNGNNIRFNFISSQADLTKTTVYLQKETSFKSFSYSAQQKIPVSVVTTNGVRSNSIDLQGTGRYVLAITAVKADNTFLESQTIRVVYMDYINDNYFVNEAWNNNWVFASNKGGDLNIHAKIHDLGNLGLNKSDVKIRFYKEGNPSNYVVCPNTKYTLTPYTDFNNYGTDYDYYLFGTVNGSSFGNTPGRYVAEIYLFGMPWQKTYATIN